MTVESLHIIGSKTMGGAERWFARFLQALRDRGHDVHAVVRRNSELELHHLQGMRLKSLPMRTVWDPLSKWEVAREVARVDAPIVQTYMGRATRLTHVPENAKRVHVARLGGYYKVAGYRHAHAWIGNTCALRDWLVQQGLPQRRVFHIYNFVEPIERVQQDEVERIRQMLRLEASDLLLLAPGRFVEFKAHDCLLEAFARVPQEIGGRRLRLLMLGDGPLIGALRRQAHDLAIEDRVVWCGWQQHPEAYFQLADIVVCPSREREPFGNVILEAWGAGKPLVVTAHRGAREIATHCKDCYMVPCDDAAALAQGIHRVAGDRALQESIVMLGRAKLRGDFSKHTIVEQYTDLYRRLVG